MVQAQGIDKPADSNRIYYLDLAKVVACFLVVYAHFFSGSSLTCKFIYAFHVPVFFFISGIFHHKDTYWPDRVILDFSSLIVPTLLFMLIDGISYSLQYSQGEGFISELIIFFKTILLGLYRGSILGPYWFLIALFWCKAFTGFFYYFKRKWLLLFVWAGLLIMPHFLLNQQLPLLLSQGLMALPFYLTGSFVASYLKQLKPNWRFLLVVTLCLLLTIIISDINGKVSMNGVYFGSLPYGLNILVFYINAFIGILLTLSISLLPFPKSVIISKLSTALITIVGVQMVFIRLFQQWFGADRNFLISASMTIITLLLCYIIHFLLNPFYKKLSQSAQLCLIKKKTCLNCIAF